MVAIGKLCEAVSLAVKWEKLRFSLIDLRVKTTLSSSHKRPSKTLSVWRVLLVFKAGKNNPGAVTEWGKSRQCGEHFLPSPLHLGCLSSTEHTHLKEPNFHGSTIMRKTLLCRGYIKFSLTGWLTKASTPFYSLARMLYWSKYTNITARWLGFFLFQVLKCHKNGNMQDVSYKREQVLALAMNQFLVLCLLL